MDPIKILKRAWHILWSYRTLWIFGIALALTTAGAFPGVPGSHGGNSSGSSSSSDITPGQSFSEGLRELRNFWREDMPVFPTIHFLQENVRSLIIIGIIFLVLLLVGIIIATFARYISETAVIRMVDEYETTGKKSSFRQGFRYGWSRTSWRLFLINLLVHLPVFLIVLFMLLTGIGVFLLAIQERPALTIASIVSGIGIFFLSIFLLFVLGVILTLLREFFWRACAIEQVGVRKSFRRGWETVRKNFTSVLLMWLVMFGIRLAWGIFLVIAIIVMIPVFFLTFLLGLLIGCIPILIIAGITSLFLSSPFPWIIGAIFGLPVFILVATSPIIFLSSLERVFYSSVWTLTYRELKILPVLAPVGVNKAPEDLAPEI
jgi:hypothetical protein